MAIEFGIGPGEKAYFAVDATAFCIHENSSVQSSAVAAVSGDVVVTVSSSTSNVVTLLADATTAKQDTVVALVLNLVNTQIFRRLVRFELGSE